jgi:hypothetical protein
MSFVAFSQNSNQLFFGGTMQANTAIYKPVGQNPWNQTIRTFNVSILPEFGLANSDMSSFFSFGLGIQTWKGQNFSPDEKYIGGLGGFSYKRALLISKSNFAPYAEITLNMSIGQSQLNQAKSEYFGAQMLGRIGVMYNPSNRWITFIGLNLISVQYNRSGSNQTFRAGLQNAGGLNLSVARLF